MALNIQKMLQASSETYFRRRRPQFFIRACLVVSATVVVFPLVIFKPLGILLTLALTVTAVLFAGSILVELFTKISQKGRLIERSRVLLKFNEATQEVSIRVLDLVVSLVIFIIYSPLLLIVALLTKISSPGPVFYRQQRIGKNGKVFTLYKFRTMVKDAEHTGPAWTSESDARVTAVGRVLRRTRLDEFPRLLNVLWGDMSLVGPRPERPHFAKKHRALRGVRLSVKPGMTGLAQIRMLYDLRPRDMLKHDYLYIQKRSLLLNLYILAKTIPAVFCAKGW